MNDSNLFSAPSTFDTLSNEQLDQRLRGLQRDAAMRGEIDELQATIQELQVHRIELELQNRALRETQEELEHAVQRYADLYDNLPIAYLTVSPKGQIIGANRAAEEWLRITKLGQFGRFLGNYLDAYDAGRFAAHLEICGQSGGPLTIELTLRPGPGQAVPVQITSRLASAGRDAAPRVHLAITDLSKQKRAQRLVEDVNREQETFNHSISHDLRAPLVTINNYAAIVLSDFSEAMDPQARKMIERIRVAAQRMEDTLKRLLDYGSLAREEVVPEPVNTDNLITDLLIEQREQIELQNADVLVDRPLPTVLGARDMLGHVFGNLLSNALKYTQPGESPKVRIFGETTDTHALIKVVDQGIGIDPKYHERIFKVFERLHGYSRYPGSGVGLAIARRAVERMHGRIWCESEPGKGSCFCVELPRA